METINIQNEIVNYLSRGARADFFHVKDTIAKVKIVIVDSPAPAIASAAINILYQNNGDNIITLPATVSGGDTIEFDLPTFALLKPLNYWIQAVDQDQELLFYGSFTLY